MQLNAWRPEPSPESRQCGGFTLVKGGCLTSENLLKTPLIYSVSYFNWGDLEICLLVLSPSKPPTVTDCWRHRCKVSAVEDIDEDFACNPCSSTSQNFGTSVTSSRLKGNIADHSFTDCTNRQ